MRRLMVACGVGAGLVTAPAWADDYTVRVHVHHERVAVAGIVYVDARTDFSATMVDPVAVDADGTAELVVPIEDDDRRIRLTLDVNVPADPSLSALENLRRSGAVLADIGWSSSFVVPIDRSDTGSVLSIDLWDTAPFSYDTVNSVGNVIGLFSASALMHRNSGETLGSRRFERRLATSPSPPSPHSTQLGGGAPAGLVIPLYASSLVYEARHNASFAELFRVGPFAHGAVGDAGQLVVGDRFADEALGTLALSLDLAYFNDSYEHSRYLMPGPRGLCLVNAETSEAWHVGPEHPDYSLDSRDLTVPDLSTIRASFDGELRLPPGEYDLVPISLTGVFQWFPSVLETRQEEGVAAPIPGVPRITVVAGETQTLSYTEAGCRAILESLIVFDDAYRATADYLPVATALDQEGERSEAGEGAADGG